MKNMNKAICLILIISILLSCKDHKESNQIYTSVSSQTELTDHEEMLKSLPDDPVAIAEIASKQMIHHNNLQSFDILKSRKNIWTPFPPNLTKILGVLDTIEPYELSIHRPYENRLIGACVSESYFLAGLLRHKNIPVRVRAGYFKNINKFREHIIVFWEEVARYKGFNAQLMKEDTLAWKKNQNDYTQSQLEADHRIEHWVCEYWNKQEKQWILLDANNDFLKLSSKIEVGYELPIEYFEYAHEAWINMRTNSEYNPEMHAEYPQDGRSHIRSQLLADFLNLLNHDISCYSNIDIPSKEFIKERTYEDLTVQELSELDKLANLLSKNPSTDELIKFYNDSKTLKIRSAQLDSFSFVSSIK